MKSSNIVYLFVFILVGCTFEPDPCGPEIITINEETYSLLPQNIYDTVFYRCDAFSVTIKSILKSIKLDTTNVYYCGSRYKNWEIYSVNYVLYEMPIPFIMPIYYLSYRLDGINLSGTDDSYMQINLGTDTHISQCKSTFNISKHNPGAKIDSLQLQGNTYYDVYQYTSFDGCSNEMYYNKQYGVVGFNWLGEWYVLETDSL